MVLFRLAGSRCNVDHTVSLVRRMYRVYLGLSLFDLNLVWFAGSTNSIGRSADLQSSDYGSQNSSRRPSYSALDD